MADITITSIGYDTLLDPPCIIPGRRITARYGGFTVITDADIMPTSPTCTPPEPPEEGGDWIVMEEGIITIDASLGTQFITPATILDAIIFIGISNPTGDHMEVLVKGGHSSGIAAVVDKDAGFGGNIVVSDILHYFTFDQIGTFTYHTELATWSVTWS